MTSVLDELTAAVYGGVRTADDVLASVSKLHTGATGDGDPATRKKLATGALVGTAIAGVGGVHALAGTHAEHKLRTTRKALRRARKLPGPLKHVTPKQAAIAATAGWTALHGVELASDAINAHTQTKELRRANAELKADKTPDPVGVGKRDPFVPIAKGLRQTAQLGAALHAAKNSKTAQHTLFTANATAHQANTASKFKVLGWDAKHAGQQFRKSPHGKLIEDSLREAVRPGSTQARRAAPGFKNHPAAASIAAHPKAVLAIGGGGAVVGGVAVSQRRKSQYGLAKNLEWATGISKVDEDKRLVFGYCSLSTVDGQPVVDLQGDYIPIEEVEKSAYSYTLNSRKGGVMHKRAGDAPVHVADLVESFVVTPEKIEKMGLPPDALPHGWWIGFKVHDDETWDKVKSGDFGGFSVHGSGIRKDFSLDLVAKAAPVWKAIP